MLSIYESVTKTIVLALERGTVPWCKPWSGGDQWPCNLTTGKAYRGVNLFLLAVHPYRDHRWLSFKQLSARGGRLRKGEKATLVVFWKRLEPTVDKKTGEIGATPPPVLRYYNVFNVEQCEGLNVAAPYEVATTEHERIERAELLVKHMPDPPGFIEGADAWYQPKADVIQMPPLGRFRSAERYYATLFHELGHATGHARRLSRPGVTEQIQFGSGEYGREELVAELTSAFCCAAIGLDNTLVEDAAAYIRGWLGVLRNDPKAMVIAAAQAQRAADFIRGVTFER